MPMKLKNVFLFSKKRNSQSSSTWLLVFWWELLSHLSVSCCSITLEFCKLENYSASQRQWPSLLLIVGREYESDRSCNTINFVCLRSYWVSFTFILLSIEQSLFIHSFIHSYNVTTWPHKLFLCRPFTILNSNMNREFESISLSVPCSSVLSISWPM